MSDGLVSIFSLVDDLPVEGDTYLCSHTLNKSVFGLKDSDPRQRPYPVRTMVLVHRGSQLWLSNGPGVLVIDTLSLQAVQRLEPYEPPSCVVSMATSFSLWGEESVWTMDDLTNTLLLFHASSYDLCAKYCCGDSNPLRDVFPVRRPAGVTTATETDPKTTDQVESLECADGEVTVMYSEEAGTQIIQHQDSLTDYCSISSTCSDLASSHTHGIKLLPPSHPGGPGGVQEQQVSISPDLDSAGPEKTTETELQAFSVLPVNGTLWIPRRGGDVMVIEVQSHGDQLTGRVIAVLRPPQCSSLGVLQEAALVAHDTVVCGFQQENSAWCLCVWRGWGCSELELFYQSYEELSRLESSMRRRR